MYRQPLRQRNVQNVKICNITLTVCLLLPQFLPRVLRKGTNHGRCTIVTEGDSNRSQKDQGKTQGDIFNHGHKATVYNEGNEHQQLQRNVLIQ